MRYKIHRDNTENNDENIRNNQIEYREKKEKRKREIFQNQYREVMDRKKMSQQCP